MRKKKLKVVPFFVAYAYELDNETADAVEDTVRWFVEGPGACFKMNSLDTLTLDPLMINQLEEDAYVVMAAPPRVRNTPKSH